MARVLLPLPAQDFDPSEAAVSWRVLASAGHVVDFATPDGQPAVADDIMLSGKGLDLSSDFCCGLIATHATLTQK
jgi:putative intracellular protease/amidase